MVNFNQFQNDNHGPVVTIESVSSINEKSVIANYKKNSRDQSPILFLAKYVKLSPMDGTVSLLFKGQEKVLEVGGTVTHLRSYSCQGYRLNSTVLIHGSEPYSLEANACAPGFAQVIVGKRGDSKQYDAQLGLKTHRTALATLTKRTAETSASLWQRLTFANLDYQPEEKILDLSFDLRKPTLLSIGAHYDSEKLQRYYVSNVEYVFYNYYSR